MNPRNDLWFPIVMSGSLALAGVNLIVVHHDWLNGVTALSAVGAFFFIRYDSFKAGKQRGKWDEIDAASEREFKLFMARSKRP